MAVSRLNQQRIDGLRPRGKIYSVRDAGMPDRRRPQLQVLEQNTLSVLYTQALRILTKFYIFVK